MVKNRRSPHVNNILNKVEKCLRSERKPLSLMEIERLTKLALQDREDLISIIRDNRKIHYDDTTERYSLTKIYGEITSKETLVDFLKKSPRGIPENDDLMDCYRGIEKDVEELYQKKFIRKIYNNDKDKKFNVLFYNDPNDTVEGLVRPVDDFVKSLWKEIGGSDKQERSKTIEAYKRKL